MASDLLVVAHLDVQTVPVCHRIHCNRLKTELFAGSDDSDSNLAAVCDKDLAEGRNF